MNKYVRKSSKPCKGATSFAAILSLQHRGGIALRRLADFLHLIHSLPGLAVRALVFRSVGALDIEIAKKDLKPRAKSYTYLIALKYGGNEPTVAACRHLNGINRKHQLSEDVRNH